MHLLDHPAIDPWWDIYMPAAFGDADAVADAVDAAEHLTPARDRGDLYAVAARAYALLGRGAEADRFAARAEQIGGAEADALATFLYPDGRARAERRLARGGRPGARADAACDLAALSLLAGDLAAARTAVSRAEAACPGHAEAGHWARFLDENPDPQAVIRAAVDLKPRRPASAQMRRDVDALVPVRRRGWVSGERYVRRLLGTPPEHTWAPASTALGRLQDAGVGVYFFALDLEYARERLDHPLVRMELRADEVAALVDEERDARAAGEALWSAARALDDEASNDAAQLLASLGTADRRLAPLALDAVAWLAAHRGAQAQLWEGYRCWLGHLSGVPCAEAAWQLASTRPVDPVAWRLAVETLRAEEPGPALDALVRAARAEPALSQSAHEIIQAPRPEPFRMMVGGRVTPRWPQRGPWIA
jgi:hypothetical protein